MAQFDVYDNPMADQRVRIPYWLDLQSDHIAQLQTRVIIPLRTAVTAGTRIEGLQPLVNVGKQSLCADVPSLASFPSRLLRDPVARIDANRHELVAALDYLISGF
ncbi:MAG: CcdB-like toxin protein [Polaromonas sp.]|jgi:toxin CcdB|nr:CcdB-like toxin protein [Polaromonas sp.]